jgi:hypothetical protein
MCAIDAKFFLIVAAWLDEQPDAFFLRRSGGEAEVIDDRRGRCVFHRAAHAFLELVDATR